MPIGAAHLNSTWGKQYAWTVYHSKYARLKKIWRAFAKLKGLRQTFETDIGWNENRMCFLAEESQWNNLQMVFFPLTLIQFQPFNFAISDCHYLVMPFSCFLRLYSICKTAYTINCLFV